MDDALDLVVRWAGGDHTPLRVRKNRVGKHRWSTDADVVELVAVLARAAYDEVMTAGIKRQCEPPRIVGDLLQAEKQARSIKYQLTIAKLPLAKDIDDFQFDGTPINEALARELATGAFLTQQRNAVLIGGTDQAS